MVRPEILVADVDPLTRAAIARALVNAGYRVRTTGTAATLWRLVQARVGDLVVAEAALPDEDTFELMPRLKKLRPALPAIIMSAQGGLSSAIRAHECGAYDYVLKPFDPGYLLSVIQRATSNGPRLSPKGKDILARQPWIGRSPVMDAINNILDRLAKTDTAVLLSGESGTGKSFFARMLHDRGRRAGRPFVSFNVAAFSADMVEEELFGRGNNALGDSGQCAPSRIQQAEGGTLFLEEIGDMPRGAQDRLISVLQRSEYIPVGDSVPVKCNVRIVAAARKDPRLLAESGQLYDHLLSCSNVSSVTLPPLRDRVEDIPYLVDLFFDLGVNEGLPCRRIEEAALDRLMRYQWPGNLRELRDLIRRIAVLHPDEVVGEKLVARELAQDVCDDATNREPRDKDAQALETACRKSLAKMVETTITTALSDGERFRVPPGLYYRIIRDVEAPLVSTALAATRGHQIEAARLLGIDRNTLRKKSPRQMG
ncbi:MAG TPA: sigma-54 dependent transcriptional regulator [Methylocystis sp.]|jgi:two-component system nitrogen regulation response regulator GlnG